MLQQISNEVSGPLPASTADFESLDDTIEAMAVAIDIIQHILKSVPDFAFIIDGFQFLDDSGSTKVQTLVDSFLELFDGNAAAADVGMSPRLLFAASGNTPPLMGRDSGYMIHFPLDPYTDKGPAMLANELIGIE